MHLGDVIPGLAAILADEHSSIGMIENPRANDQTPRVPCVRENVIDDQVVTIANLTQARPVPSTITRLVNPPAGGSQVEMLRVSRIGRETARVSSIRS